MFEKLGQILPNFANLQKPPLTKQPKGNKKSIFKAYNDFGHVPDDGKFWFKKPLVKKITIFGKNPRALFFGGEVPSFGGAGGCKVESCPQGGNFF